MEFCISGIHGACSIFMGIAALTLPDSAVPWMLLGIVLVIIHWYLIDGCILTKLEEWIKKKTPHDNGNQWKGNFFDKKLSLLYGLNLSEHDLNAVGNAYHAFVIVLLVLRFIAR